MTHCISSLKSLGSMSTGLLLFSLVFFAAGPVSASSATTGEPPSASDACALLTPGDIAKATGLKVETGTAGRAIPGVLGKCTWAGSGDTKVIVVLGDTQHIRLTIAAAEQSGGSDVPGLGSKAAGIEGAPFTGGGYVLNVLDSKGGFGVSILGKEGTRDRAIALAKVVESHR